MDHFELFQHLETFSVFFIIVVYENVFLFWYFCWMFWEPLGVTISSWVLLREAKNSRTERSQNLT